jgi:lysophospholipase L1-like esterase
MRRIWILAALALLGAAPSQDRIVPVHVGGRVVAESEGAMRFGWPAVYFEGRFEGTYVTIMADPRDEQLAVLVDGKRRMVLSKAGPAMAVVDGLKPGAHVVRLEKLTESQSGYARFMGFATDGKPLPPAPRKSRIEFIGDSHSAGYGNTSPKRECTRQEVHDTTDTQQAFGPLAAKRLDMDYRVIAYSGFGIVRNYNGAVPGDSLPKRYARALPGEEAAAKDDGWKPDWIVIKLGSNDFSTPLHPGEAWADQNALHADYRAKYAEFLAMLIAKQPQAKFVLMAAGDFYGDVEAVAKGAGKPVKVIRWVELENTGCDWHPSLKDHRNLADQVEAAIRNP